MVRLGRYMPEENRVLLYHGWVGLTRVLTPGRSIALLAALVVLVLTGSALAADPGLVDQYVEDIPTAGGTHHSGGSAGPTGSGGSTAGPTTGSATLTPAVEDDLKAAGRDGEKLKEVAASARYGAPRPHRPRVAPSSARRAPSARPLPPSGETTGAWSGL